MLEQHVARLLASWRIMFGKDSNGSDSSPMLSASHLLTQIVRLMQRAITHFAPEQRRHLDLKITMLLTEHQHLYMYFVPYKDSLNEQREYTYATIASGSRKDMPAKDSIWVQKMREELLSQKVGNSEEVIMCEEDGTLREGVSSNVFAIGHAADSTQENPKYELFTAFEGIIFGTVRNLVMKVVEEGSVRDSKGDKVHICSVKKDIDIRDLQKYKEMFITSTSRSVMPFSHVYTTKDVRKRFDTPHEVRFDEKCEYPETISHHLDKRVMAEMISASFDLCGEDEE